ncbi:MAG: [Fe-Fe] hydrogenase large subunit C-terminal domain-containing protein [Candidatus Levybacteria bacterium]|nr:[Fe-Fe] hydrogenase large subunit C-terminal domain-containing protein [Candidatus Levybacteria bacterium]
MNEVDALIQALGEKKKLVAMLAPSFPIVFSYPSIVAMLRKLGFSYVVEVSLGAKKTNEELAILLKNNPNNRYITSPCPTIVRMVRQQMPQYVKYFTHDVDSPMIATAKIVKEKYPDCQPIFIGPCVVKKLEAKEDNPDLNILVLTYDELAQIFAHFDIQEELGIQDQFDLGEEGMTRIYPIDGGLSHSSGLMQNFQSGEVQAVSGWENCMEAIKSFDINPKIRLLDILFCEGGCIGGPGIKSTLSTEERKKKILDYAGQT